MPLSPADIAQVQSIVATALASARVKISALPDAGTVTRASRMAAVIDGATVGLPLARILDASVTTVPTGQDLRAMDMATVTDGARFRTLGVNTAGDGGGGSWRYDENSAAPDNIGTVIAPDSGTGRFLREFETGYYDPMWFEAKFDGLTDDAVALDATVDACAEAGGGVVQLPPGTAILGTVSGRSGSQYSYIVPRDGVSIIGAGMGVSVLKVASGQNTIYAGVNGPNVITTSQTDPLTDCVFRDFTVDWNGANNLLTNLMTARQNCAIFSLNGGTRILCERIQVKETPGNQCIFFPCSSEAGQGDITIRLCRFEDSGSGLVGNYNIDHSSIYLNGDRNHLEYCTFATTQRVNGTCFELHGSDTTAFGCVGDNYTLSFYVASDFKPLEHIGISHCYFTELASAIGYSCPTHAVDDVSITHCVFEQSAADTYTSGQTFILGFSPGVVCNRLTIDHCTFKGQSTANCRMMLVTLTRELALTTNKFSGFIDLGIWFSGVDLGNGRSIDSLKIVDNDFDEVLEPIYHNAAGVQFGSMTIQSNTFLKAASTANIAILIVAAAGGVGRIADNNISANYTGGTGGSGIQAAVTGLFVEQYNQGTWVPVVVGLSGAGTATYTVQKGEWTKVGNRVFFEIYVVFTGHTGTGGVSITLPTGVAAPSGAPHINLAPIHGVFSETIALDAAKQLTGLVVYGGPYVALSEIATGAAAALAMGADATILVAGSYLAVI